MAGGMNLATKYSRVIMERWALESLADLVVSKDFDMRGDKTCVMYSIPFAPLNDYTRSGLTRYGTADDLSRNVQAMVVSQDKGFTFIIDKGDYVQSEFVCNPGSALAREIREVIVPAYDKRCFSVLAASAVANGHNATTAITTANAHAMLLNGVAHMAGLNVPTSDVYAFCTYDYANKLMQDSSFMRYGDLSQKMLKRGQIGQADGVEIVLCPPSRLPYGAAFLLVHKDAACAPHQLEEYKTHQDPPGISGTLVEGRVLYDCFVFDDHSDGIYFHGGQSVLGNLPIMTKASASGKSTILVNADKEKTTNRWYAKTAADHASLPAVTYGTPIDVTTASSPWYGATQLTAKSTEITPTSGHTRVKVVEVLSNMNPVAVGEVPLHIG